MRRNEKKKRNTGLIIFRIVSLIIIIICLIVLYLWHKNNEVNNKVQEELTSYAKIVDKEQEKIEETKENVEEKILRNSLEVNFNELKEKNPDTVAWIKLENTNIDYPVVQSIDNNYYLKRNFNKKSNGAGWIFADYRDNFKELNRNIVIYGHNRRNGSMFSNLKQLLKDNWFEEENNRYFYFATPEKSYIVEIFSVYTVKANGFSIPTDFENEDQFYEYLTNIKNMSNYAFNVEVNKENNIVTLCTCGNNTNYRIVVHGKLVEE